MHAESENIALTKKCSFCGCESLAKKMLILKDGGKE